MDNNINSAYGSKPAVQKTNDNSSGPTARYATLDDFISEFGDNRVNVKTEKLCDPFDNNSNY